MIYIVCFALSVFFAYLDTRNEKRKHIGVFGWIAILLPAALAGFRDASVGTDTANYIREFTKLINLSFREFLASKTYMERGIRFLFFIVSRFTDNPAGALFAVHLFIMFFIYKGLRENGAGRYTWLGLTVFYLLFFSYSLNTMRQDMATALIFWGFKYVKKEKLPGWIAVIFFAALIHSSSVIAIFIYLLYQIYLIRTDGTYNNGTAHRVKPEIKTVISFCLLAGAIIIFLCARPLIKLVHDITGRFSVQANNIRDYFAIDLYSIGYKLLLLLPFVLLRKSNANANGNCDFFIMIIALCMILSQLSMVSFNAGRITASYWILFVLAVPTLVSRLKERSNRVVVSSYYLLICGWMYVNYIVIKGFTGVWPYTSKMLGIV